MRKMNILKDQLEQINNEMRESNETSSPSPFMNISAGLTGLGFELKATSGDFETQLNRIVSKAVAKEYAKLEEKINELSQKLDFFCEKSLRNPKIIRQMVQELRICAIEKEYNIILNENDTKWEKNQFLFENEYSTRCKMMYDKYNLFESDHYLKRLFTYDLSPFNKLLHENLSNYTIQQVKCEIESFLNDKLEDIPNSSVAVFFGKWQELRANDRTVQQSEQNANGDGSN